MNQLPSFDNARVLVVGDVMLDRYWFGDVERISPEAPVPVLKVARVEDRPGGAANVARNIAALGAQCTLLSVVGNDEPGSCLEKLMREQPNVNALLYRDDTIATTIKLRAVARQVRFQLVNLGLIGPRVDREQLLALVLRSQGSVGGRRGKYRDSPRQ